MKRLVINLIEFYQAYLSFDKGLLSVFAPGGSCKYDLSCSEYAKQSIRKFGIFDGGWMGIKRIWSCR